ncbi:integrating conjugative element protein [Salmonella enterica]|nr:integrating conjugative element protein [Salmonella enterica]ECC1658129.1 integrating conjugative element protein [Salmonella enterica subsp. salamae]ASG86826.1 conjugal transfer protein [Salmonella enterica subsp. salamae serovar 55:k:z39 str. 1315K]ECD9415866.1 integrating conjugative element protein [Salmonella enterica subsp. salamae]ECF5932725.1 integrating conjugative element protein [Salmonella enterica subsp. salamae]ECG1251637.1 integrating conjugative element protein [Salmonella e
MASILLSTSSMAALNVIADLGGEPTAPLFDAINNENNEFTPPRSLTPSDTPSGTPAGVSDMLPVSTPEMRAGKVEPRGLTLTGMTPVFLVGDDALSRQWLTLRRDELKRLRATGLVVNVSDKAALSQLQQLVPGVTLLPASASEIARRLQLSHYPVLITASGLTQ